MGRIVVTFSEGAPVPVGSIAEQFVHAGYQIESAERDTKIENGFTICLVGEEPIDKKLAKRVRDMGKKAGIDIFIERNKGSDLAELDSELSLMGKLQSAARKPLSDTESERLDQAVNTVEDILTRSILDWLENNPEHALKLMEESPELITKFYASLSRRKK